MVRIKYAISEQARPFVICRHADYQVNTIYSFTVELDSFLFPYTVRKILALQVVDVRLLWVGLICINWINYMFLPVVFIRFVDYYYYYYLLVMIIVFVCV